MNKNYKRYISYLIATILLLCMVAFTNSDLTYNTQNIPAGEAGLYVHFVDVGQADCILIKFPDGESMLIDAGNNSDGDKVCKYIENLGVKKIDYLALTHPHADHIGGMDDVLRKFDIGSIFMPRATANSATYEDVLYQIKKKGMKITAAKEGVIICDGEVKAEILSPCRDYYEELNDYSAVIRLTYGNSSFLFTGDAEALVESDLLKRYNLKTDVLKVGHHGSNTSSTADFIKAVNPQIAVISVGIDNDYGHPSSKVIKRLEKNGATIYRTDKCGDIILYSDGRNVVYIGENKNEVCN